MRTCLFRCSWLMLLFLFLMASTASAQNHVLSLDGDGDYVEIVNNEGLNAIDSQVTIEAWVKVTAFTNIWTQLLFKADEYIAKSGFNHRNYTLGLQNDGQLFLHSKPNGRSVMNIWTPRGLIVRDRWYHLASVIDAKGGLMRVFINGMEAAHGDFGESIRTSTLPFRIGAHREPGFDPKSTSPFAGQFDEVRVWRVARTEAEIRQTMFTPLRGDETGLVTYWPFEGQDERVIDATGNGHHGQFFGDANRIAAALPTQVQQLAVLSGTVQNEAGKRLRWVNVHLKRGHETIAETQTDSSGYYHIVASSVGAFDLYATFNTEGALREGVVLHEGKHQTVDLTLKPAISIEGTLLMLDDKTPHPAVVVQAVRPPSSFLPPKLGGDQEGGEGAPTAVGATLSDEGGKYQFINLKPGRYQVRCYAGTEYVYYREGENSTSGGLNTTALQVKRGKPLAQVDFRLPSFKKGTWRHYTAFDGLPSGYVNTLHRTPDGTIWFGTQDRGLVRYDGSTFVRFTVKDGLVSNDIRAIEHDRDGTMWFGSNSGISRYDGKNFANLTVDDGLASNSVSAIYPDPDEGVWIGTWDGGVSRYDGTGFVNFNVDDGLVSNRVNAIHLDPAGGMWIGTWGGVSHYDGKTFTTQDGLAGEYVPALHADSDGGMWFVAGGGVSRYDGKTFTKFTTEDGLASNAVYAISRGPDGTMWFGTGNGVFCYDGTGFVNFNVDNDLAGGSVDDIHGGSDGTIWLTTGGGISRYDGKTFANFTTQDGLADNAVFSIARDADVMWFGTGAWFGGAGGVSRYDGKRFVNFTVKDGLVNNGVWAIHSASDGGVWIGTNEGLSRYDGEEFVNFTVEDGLAGNAVRSIYRTPDGVMWFGTANSGLFRYEEEEFVHFTVDDGLGGSGVYAIARDPDGTMWFGTYPSGSAGLGGVSVYDGEVFVKTLTVEDGLASNKVLSIDRDADGVMWFGTQDGGVSRYDRKGDASGRFVNFTEDDGLAYDGVRAIHRDSNGIMWFATERLGVSAYDGTAWTSLDTRDGLVGNWVMSIHEDADGTLWFATTEGVTRYRRSAPPTVRIRSLRIDTQDTDLSAIPPVTSGTLVTIEYRVIDFKTLPEKRQYRCRIAGLDTEWRPPTKEPRFHYTFNRPGIYTFEVQAIDRDLNYSDPASLTLTVVSPFYLRASFFVPVFGGGMIGLVMLVIQAVVLLKRRRQIHAYERLAVAELEDARRVQMRLMPETAPQIEGLEVAGKCLSANTVSGDFFDYLHAAGRSEIAIVVGDVTGHGMQGAMNAVMTDGMLHTIVEETGTLSSATLLGKLNNVLKPRMEAGMNVTMVIGLFNPDNKRLTLANAGHHAHPLLLRDGDIQRLMARGMPLGMMAGIAYREVEFPLESGDVVVLITDGVIEAHNAQGEGYQDTGRLEQAIRQFAPEMDAAAMGDAVINDALAFSGEQIEREDDMTVVVVKVA